MHSWIKHIWIKHKREGNTTRTRTSEFGSKREDGGGGLLSRACSRACSDEAGSAECGSWRSVGTSGVMAATSAITSAYNHKKLTRAKRSSRVVVV